jgi:hypothetical protein
VPRTTASRRVRSTNVKILRGSGINIHYHNHDSEFKHELQLGLLA